MICLFRALGRDGPFKREAERIARWQQHKPELAATGHRMIAISSETFVRQAMAAGLLTDWMIVSDTELRLARWLSLGVVSAGARRAYEPATLITEGGIVAKHLPSVDASDAEQVTEWLRRRATIGLAPASQVASL